VWLGNAMKWSNKMTKKPSKRATSSGSPKANHDVAKKIEPATVAAGKRVAGDNEGLEVQPNYTRPVPGLPRVYQRVGGRNEKVARQVKSITCYLEIELIRRLDVYIAQNLRIEDRSSFIGRAVTKLLEEEAPEA
jgi:hypothetical protein